MRPVEIRDPAAATWREGAGRSGLARQTQRRRLVGVLIGIAALTLTGSAPALAAPAWRLDSGANTTVAPGSTINYLLQITNIGSSSSDGVTPLVLTATMPAGLSFAGLSDAAGVFSGGSCATSAGPGGSTLVTCTTTSSIDPLRSSLPTISATVESVASGTLTTTFAVAGGDPSNPSASVADPTRVSGTLPPFGIDAFDGQITANPAGDPYSQAGGHPYAASTSIDFNTVTNPNPLKDQLWPVEATKDILVDLPPGFLGNPTAAAKCTASDLAHSAVFDSEPLCSPASQIGTTLIRFNGFGGQGVWGPVPVYNMVAPPDVPARFGFNIAGTVVTLNATLRSNSDYGLSVNVTDVPEGLALAGTTLTLWGVPADPSHNGERACPGQRAPWQFGATCTTDAPRAAFLRNPTSCTSIGTGLPTSLHLDSWVHPGATDAQGAPNLGDPSWSSATFVSHDPPAYPSPPSDWGAPQGPSSCDTVPFDPTFIATPASPAKTSTPTGFTFDVNLPQSDDPDAIGEADLKKVVVTLPEGLRVSPSTADGLGACAPAQIALSSTADPTCPEQSKMGSLTITTPLLEKPLTGSIYLATPHDNPSGSLIALYLVAKGPGVILKLPGKVESDPSSGQLTATFDNNPQLPFSNLHLEFKSGPRAPLVTPKACGIYTTHAELTSWSGKTVSSDSTFTLSTRSDGSPCGPNGFSPGFDAGTKNPIAGASSPFLLSLTRGDEDQELRSLTVSMPTGLLGRIGNAVLCPDGAANAGNCQDVSKVGSVTVGAGAGTNPFYITNGRAYITGPYKRAPFGLSIVVPAVAGPFDLGNVVVRAAIFVDRDTAALRVVSDPLPTILQGIPLDVRDVRVAIDKPSFIINPTSCAAKHVGGTISSTAGAVAHVSSHFQVSDCAALSLAPKLTLSVGAKRRTRAGVTTPFSTTLTQRPGQANLRSVSVSLPTTLNARLGVVNRACTLVQFHAGHCSSRAKIGSAVAVTPLLRDPLKGSAYFVKNPARPLPDLMVALRGQVSLDITGKVTIPGGTRLATTFDTIPDAPITRFTLRLVSGSNGPVGTTVNLCSAKGKAATATVGIRGQNGKLIQTNPRLRIQGCR